MRTLAVPGPLFVALLGESGCADDPSPGVEHRLDAELGFDDVLALGSHNSFHVPMGEPTLPAWDYAHLPLDRQADELGVRQFELDLWWNASVGGFDVLHVPFVDEASTCGTLSACLAVLAAWSSAHPAHQPLLTLLEMKDPLPDDAVAQLGAIEGAVQAAFGSAAIRPREVQGDCADLRDGLASGGWLTLGQTRGRALFVLHDTGAWRDTYVAPGTGDLWLFPDGGGDLARRDGVVHTMNDAAGQADAIAEAVDLGLLVRTRADADTEQARALDYATADAALASGAHFVSTDFPAPHPDTGYEVRIPGGTPSACNPRRAPSGCLPSDVEDPVILAATQVDP